MPPGELAGLLQFSDTILDGQSGLRVFDRAEVSAVLGPAGSIGRCAATILGAAARPVRGILFDKTADNNWTLPWHQDRTIAVRARHDVPGFGPWPVKAGVIHVEPPFDILERMITIRAHLDDCAEDNAPLLIVPGSHRLGRVAATRAAEIARELGQAACLAEAGDLWVYATSIVHASERAHHPRRRAASIGRPDAWSSCGRINTSQTSFRSMDTGSSLRISTASCCHDQKSARARRHRETKRVRPWRFDGDAERPQRPLATDRD